MESSPLNKSVYTYRQPQSGFSLIEILNLISIGLVKIIHLQLIHLILIHGKLTMGSVGIGKRQM